MSRVLYVLVLSTSFANAALDYTKINEAGTCEPVIVLDEYRLGTEIATHKCSLNQVVYPTLAECLEKCQ